MKYGTPTNFIHVNPIEFQVWEEIFPGVNVDMELRKASAWMVANPDRPKKRLKRFFFNWLSRAHGRLLEAQVITSTREMIRDEQRHRDARVGEYRES
jgi:hypothetical protein